MKKKKKIDDRLFPYMKGTLEQYFDWTKEKKVRFCERCEISRSYLNRILKGKKCSMRLAGMIEEATHGFVKSLTIAL